MQYGIRDDERGDRPQDGATETPLRVAMIGLRGIPATYGGVERAVEELSANLVGRGHEVTVYARNAYSDPGVGWHRGVKVVRLPQINTKHAEAVSHTALAVAHAVASRRYDLIHLHATGPGSFAPLLRLAGMPVVVTVQGLDWRREKWGRAARLALRMAARLVGRAPDRTIVVSRELKRHFRDAHSAETVYIPNGVQADPEQPDDAAPGSGLTPDGFVLFLGRLVPEKHVHTLIEAYRKVQGDLPLVIAGPDSHSPEYLERLETLSAADDRVQLVGPQYGASKRWLMNNALTFVQPSSVEGLPIALLEALSAARYPIVSDIRENLEPVTVDDDHLGLNVPVGDVPALTSAIETAVLATDRREVGLRLAAHVRSEYDWAGIAASTESVYRDAVAA